MCMVHKCVWVYILCRCVCCMSVDRSKSGCVWVCMLCGCGCVYHMGVYVMWVCMGLSLGVYGCVCCAGVGLYITWVCMLCECAWV